MHIPDGYLSPATCATLYVAAASFWYTALRRVQRLLNEGSPAIILRDTDLLEPTNLIHAHRHGHVGEPMHSHPHLHR